MGSDLVVARIRAWREAGLIDPATADRLEAAELAAPDEPAPDWTGVAPPVPGGPRATPLAGRGPIVTATEVFAYLGAAFTLGAWYALVVSEAPDDPTTWFGAAALLVALVLAAVAWGIHDRGPRARRAAGVVLVIAYPHLATGLFLVVDGMGGPEGSAPAGLAAAVAVLTAAIAFVGRVRLPALTTQAGLALAIASAGWLAVTWIETLIAPATDGFATVEVEPAAMIGRVLLQVAWWLAVAGVMAVALIVSDRAPGFEKRRRLGRASVGLMAVLGTSIAAVTTWPWWATGHNGEPVLAPVVGALLMLVVSGGFIGLALRRAAVDYLWPGGLGVFIALSYLNAQILAESGLWIALLVEAAALFAIAASIRRLAARIRPATAIDLPPQPAPA